MSTTPIHPADSMRTTAPRPVPALRKTAVLTIILASYLMIVLDISIVITALPKIHRELGFSATGLSWVQTAYTLAFGGLLLLGARAGDLLGRRRMFVIGIALFTAASLAVGLAQSAAWLIFARAIQGMGAAVLAPSTLALLQSSFPEGTERTRAVAYYGAARQRRPPARRLARPRHPRHRRGGAGSGTLGPSHLLAHRVAAALTVGTAMLTLALAIVYTLILRDPQTTIYHLKEKPR
jgi:MFS family permease